MKKVKGFSYDTEIDKDVIEHIEKQPHQSNYIWSLVRADMSRSNSDMEHLVRKYVNEILKEKNIKGTIQETKIKKTDIQQLLNIG